MPVESDEPLRSLSQHHRANVLRTLARLERELAAAYEVASRSSLEPVLHVELARCRDEHLHHLATLNEVLARLGEEPVSPRLDDDTLLLPRLAELFTPNGANAVLLGLLGNAQLATAAYEMATEQAWDDETKAMLARHLADAERQLDWLGEQQDLHALATQSPDDPIARA